MLSKQVFKYVLIGGLIAVLYIPFIIADSQLFPFITGKAFTFRILVEILFGIWLIAMFYDSSLRPRFSWIMGAVLLFLAVITLADITGISLYKSFWSNFERMDGLITTLHLSAYFLIIGSVLNTRALWKIFWNASVVASVVMAFYVFLQLAGKLTINQGGVRVDGTFGNATYLAVFMLFNFFLTLFLIARSYQSNQNNQSANKWPLFGFYLVALVSQLISLYFTATRGAILGLIGGFFIATLVVLVFGREYPTFRRLAAGGLIGVLVLVGIFFAIRSSDFVAKSPTLNRFSTLSIEAVSKQGRRYVWPMAVSGFLENPILGWGQENFNYVFNKYYDPRMYNQEPWFDRAHNIVLDWLVAGGLLGLLSYLSLFGASLYLILKNKNITVPEKGVLVGLIAAYFFQNLFVFDNLVSYIYFFSLLAFIHSESVREKTESNWLRNFYQNQLISQKVLPVVVVVLVLSIIYSLNIKPILASRAIIRALNFNQNTPEQSLDNFKQVFKYKTFADGEAAEQMFIQLPRFVASSASPEIKQSFAILASEKLEAQTKKFPGDARYLLFMGSLRNRIGDYGGALPFLDEARKFSPKKQNILFEAGLSFLSMGDNTRALEIFKTAYDLALDFPEANILYAVGLIYNKNLTLAKEVLSSLDQSSIYSDERIIAAYAGAGFMPEAIKIIEERIKQTPEDYKLYFRLAAGYLEMGQRNHSVEILREIIRLFPDLKGQAEHYITEIQAGRNP